NRVVEDLVDPFVVFFAAHYGAVELFTIQQGDDSVLEFHVGNFARQGKIADIQFVDTVGQEGVLYTDTTAGAEGEAFIVTLLRTAAFLSTGGQGDDHVGYVAIGFHDGDRTRIAHRVMRNVACGVQILVDKGRAHLQCGGVV